MDYSEADHDVWQDPVSHETIDPRTSQHQSFYDGKRYHFADIVNKQTFDDDPELWVSTPHVSETSASLSPIGEPEN